MAPGTADLPEVAGDQPHHGAGVLAGEQADLLGLEVLVARAVDHFWAAGRLTHSWMPWNRPPPSSRSCGGHLAVDHAGAGGHPLGGAVGDHAAAAVRVAVPHLAVDHVGHGLEPAVRMVGRALGLAGRVLDRAHVVEHQERVGETQVDPRGGSPDLESLAFQELRCVHDGVDGAGATPFGGDPGAAGRWRRRA